MALERLAIFGLPIAAGIATALSILGPGRAAPVEAARVLGRVGPGAPALALRIVTLRDTSDGIEPLACAELAIELRDVAAGTETTSARVAVDEGGVVEVVLARPGGAPKTPTPTPSARFAGDAKPTLALVIRCGTRELAAGLLEERALGWGDRAGWLEGELEGEVRLGVRLPRGMVAPPFPEPVQIEAYCPGCASDLVLSVHSDGADVTTPEAARPDDVTLETGRAWSTTLRASAPAVELELEAHDGAGHSGRFRGAIPVANGALWIDPDARDGLVVRAPGPQRRAFVSLLGDSGRLGGFVVPLAPDDSGFQSGRIPASELPPDLRAAVVAADPAERGSGAALWPLDATGALPDDPAVSVLCDGLPAARAEEELRRRASRLPFVIAVLAAGLIEVVLLWRIGRSPARARPAPAGEDVVPLTPLRLAPLVATIGLALAFAALAAVAMWVAF